MIKNIFSFASKLRKYMQLTLYVTRMECKIHPSLRDFKNSQSKTSSWIKCCTNCFTIEGKLLHLYLYLEDI